MLCQIFKKRYNAFMHELTLEDILNAYCNGIFPMADCATDELEDIGWYSPPERGIIPLEEFHIPRSLKKYIRSHKDAFIVTVNHDFEAVIDACAAPAKGREETWINPTIKNWFMQFHDLGFAHSIEYRHREDYALQGGLYGLSIGGAFFGESMFSRVTNASKIALVALASHLKHAGFSLLDAQFVNDHLKQFGCTTMAKEVFVPQLHDAIRKPLTFTDHLEIEKSEEQNFVVIPQARILSALR